jgi:hypothetical protein
MGAADDIKKGLTKGLANFTKQRKAEEKHSNASEALEWVVQGGGEINTSDQMPCPISFAVDPCLEGTGCDLNQVEKALGVISSACNHFPDID